MHKQGIDEVGGGEVVFAHQGSQGRRAPQPAGTIGELHGRGRAGRILRTALTPVAASDLPSVVAGAQSQRGALNALFAGSKPGR